MPPLPNARNGLRFPAPPMSGDKTSRPRKRRPARQRAAIASPAQAHPAPLSFGTGKENIRSPAPQELLPAWPLSTGILPAAKGERQKTEKRIASEKKPQSEKPQRASAPRIGRGRLRQNPLEAPATNPSSLLFAARTDTAKSRIPRHDNPPRTRCAVTRRKRTEDRPASGSPQLPSPHAHRPALRKGEIQKGIRKFGCPFAESGGFEPPVPVTRYGSLANCWFQPLTQLSFHKGARLDRGTKLIHFYEIPNSRRIFSRFPRVDPLRRIRR